ncbi:hypothetical protein H7J93_14725 [Mycobacterium barrassiae]|uniref:hypothetical protein n=1 Tax=Mycobacterium barrassiae TaxID=319709 RepID=UPI002265A2DC|nr:hypothetical protein [Mycobacterium barrassiae]MCV7300878.1 hypothetical protein [Mycobacterium barrassiae]
MTRHYDRIRETPEFARRSLAEGLRLTQQRLHEELALATQRGDVQAITATSREIRLTTRELANLDGLHAPKQVEVQVTHFRSPAEILADAERELMAVLDAEVVEIPEIEQ